MQEVEGRVAVVTGGAHGIGKAIGRRLGQAGMKVVLADVLAEPLAAAEAELSAEGLEVTGVVTDVTDPDSVAALARTTLDTYGGVHVVCNNAGVGSGAEGYLWEYELNDWRWCIDVNVWGVIHGIRTFVPIMISQGEEGHVVNTSSGNGGIAPMGETPVYEMTKAAVTVLSEDLYCQLRRSGTRIGCSVLFPGPNWLRTHLWEAWRDRPERYARAAPRTSGMSFDDLVQMLRESGQEVQITPLEDVAETVYSGIVEDRFWMLPASDRTDTQIRARAESMLRRENPTYFRALRPES